MESIVPGKITLHSTSKIPLSERFKMVQQTALIKKNIEPVVKPRIPVKVVNRGSLKNRRLAAALASKPSIRAALKIKNKSIKQRVSGEFFLFSFRNYYLILLVRFIFSLHFFTNCCFFFFTL